MKGTKGNNPNLYGTKQAKPPRDIVPPIFTEIRKPNPIIKNEEIFKIKKPKKVKEYLNLIEDFPEWPTKEELDVIKNIKKLKKTFKKFNYRISASLN